MKKTKTMRDVKASVIGAVVVASLLVAPKIISEITKRHALAEGGMGIVPMMSCLNELASGGLGGPSPATWTLCDDGVMIISGGTANNSTGNLNQNRVPVEWRPFVTKIVFTDVVTAGTSVQDLFNGFTNLTEIVGIELLDTSAVTTMRSMFAHTPNLVALDLTSFDTSNVQNFLNMFLYSGITYLDVSGWDTSSATNVNSMFRNATNLKALDTSSWTFIGVPTGTTGGAIDMARMFERTYSLTTIGDVSGWVTSGVTRYYNMFSGARSLVSLPGIGLWDTSCADRMSGMFAHTWSLEELDLSGWVTTAGGVNMFNNMHALRKLTLGPGFAVEGNTALRNAMYDVYFTGYWVNVGSGTVTNPYAGYRFATGAGLMNHGLRPVGLHSWVWERRVPLVDVKFVGEGGAVILTTLVVIGDTVGAGLLLGVVASEGYEFSHWVSNQHVGVFTDAEMRGLMINGDTVFTAVFRRGPGVPDTGFMRIAQSAAVVTGLSTLVGAIAIGVAVIVARRRRV